MVRNNAIVWKLVYKIYPPFLRVLEKIDVHSGRQDFLLGHLKSNVPINKINTILVNNGFEPAILSWKDTGEILNLRKNDKDIFQYHLRIFHDGEIRGHYEYSSEGNPWKHVFAKHFVPEEEYFNELLEPKFDSLLINSIAKLN